MSFCPAVNDSRSFHLSHLLIWLPSSTFAFTLHSLYDEKFLPLLVLLHLHPHSFPTRLPLPTSSSSATSPTFSPLPPSRTLFLCLSVCRPTYVLIVLFDLRVLFLLFLCPYDRIYRLFHTRVGYSNARSMSVSLFLFMSLLFYLRVLFHLFLPPSACTWRLLPWYTCLDCCVRSHIPSDHRRPMHRMAAWVVIDPMDPNGSMHHQSSASLPQQPPQLPSTSIQLWSSRRRPRPSFSTAATAAAGRGVIRLAEETSTPSKVSLASLWMYISLFAYSISYICACICVFSVWMYLTIYVCCSVYMNLLNTYAYNYLCI